MRTFLKHLENSTNLLRRRISYRSHKDFIPNLTRTETTPEGVLWLSFNKEKSSQEITIPIPVKDKCGNFIIIKGHVKRAVGTWMVSGEEKTYWELMTWLLTERVEEYLPTTSKRVYLERLLRSFDYEVAPMVFRNFQKVIDGFINKLP